MVVRAQKLRPFHADGPITKSCTLGRAGNDTDVLGHDTSVYGRLIGRAIVVLLKDHEGESSNHGAEC